MPSRLSQRISRDFSGLLSGFLNKEKKKERRRRKSKNDVLETIEERVDAVDVEDDLPDPKKGEYPDYVLFIGDDSDEGNRE